MIVSPDVGSVARCRTFAQSMGMDLAIVDKRRPMANQCEVMNIIGDIRGKVCIMLDDIVDTAGSLCNAADALSEAGAEKVYACVTHGVLSGNACERVEKSALEELVLLNTIPLPETCTTNKIKQLDVAPMFARAIRHIYEETSISDLF